ncbi:MAG: MBL fold metallo-hydrolase, partial [Pseudomonadota bacterium]
MIDRPPLPDLSAHAFTRPEVKAFFHDGSNTLTYVVADPATGTAVVIDPVRDYDQASGRLGSTAAEEVLAFVKAEGLKVTHILETHVHADHLSAAPFMKAVLGATLGIGARVTEVQEVFGEMFAAGDDFALNGSQFDLLFEDGARFEVGGLSACVIATPGHTPACVSYLIGDAVFCGDTVFMPDFGTARCDFPGGDARVLYHSVQRLFGLPEETRLFVGHDYLTSNRKDYAWETTSAEQRAKNIHL